MTEEEDTGYDGPTINGRPVLQIDEVQKWFSAEQCDISSECAASIARQINDYDLFSFHWKDVKELKAARRKNPSKLRLRRIHDALKVLQVDLAIEISEWREIIPDAITLEAFEDLLVDLKKVAPAFQAFASKGPGREADRWHNVARNLGRLIATTYGEFSGRQAGLGKPTCPAIRILKLALGRLNEFHTEEAIVDAVRPKRKRKRRPPRPGK